MISEKNNNKYDQFNHIRSFVCRKGRITKAQQHGLDKYWKIMGIDFVEHKINLIKSFNRDAPITLEIGFGMGASLIEMVKNFPERNFLGIEVYLPGIGSCLYNAHKEKVKNLRLIHYDAIKVLHKMIPDNSLNIVQLFFPDPWFKNKQNKRRIVQIPFVKLVKNKLKLGGIFHIATDWEPYAKYILRTISLVDGYKNKSINNDYIPRPSTRPVTKFEQRSYILGHNVWDIMFEKYYD